MKPTRDLIRSRLLREGLGARIDREEFDLIGPDGVEIDPKVWPADIIERTEIQLLFWEENEAAEAEQAQNRREQAQDQRQQDQDRREEAQTRRDQAQTRRDQAQTQRDQTQTQRDREQNQRSAEQDQRQQAQNQRDDEQNQRQQAQDQRELDEAVVKNAHGCTCRTCEWTQREFLAFFACRRRLGDYGKH